ncbi:MAG: orotidine 5'-phosphate decarboxylase [Patescibacteria group bacterium]|nr:orotidine 5'-phosphate decarboxylase [Patescibacteria group bacterium]
MVEIICCLDMSHFSGKNQGMLKELKKRNLIGMARVGRDTLDRASGVNGYSVGSVLINRCLQLEVPVFLDAKIFEIGSQAVQIAQALLDQHEGIRMLTVVGHELGEDTLRRIKLICQKKGVIVVATTSLTDTNNSRTMSIAKKAGVCGLQMVVCAGEEIELVRPLGAVVPGVRPAWATWVRNDDQRRTATPEAVVKAKYVVVGRPINESPNPIETAERLHSELRPVRAVPSATA